MTQAATMHTHMHWWPSSRGSGQLSHTCAGDNGLAVRRDSQVEHAQRVASQRGQLGHGRVAPHDDLVLAVTVRAHNLVDILAPRQVAHLAACTATTPVNSQSYAVRVPLYMTQAVCSQ